MTISVQCPECSAKLSVPSEAAGKRVRCLKCKSVVKVPAAKPKAVEDDSDYDVEVLPDDDGKMPLSRKERSQSSRDLDDDDPPKKSKSPALVLILVAVFGIVVVGSGLGYYFFFRTTSKSLEEPLAGGSGTTNQRQPTGDEELYKALSGTEWAWGQGVEFKANMDAINANWQVAGFTMRWDPIDRRTVVVNLERGRADNRLAVLTFSDDLKQFRGYEFEGLNRLNVVKRKGDTGAAPYSISSTTPLADELKQKLSETKWDWGDGVLTFQSNGQVHQPAWGDLVTLWEAIDRRTAILKVTGGRRDNLFAVLRFSEDLETFSGYEFRGGRFLKTKTRVGGSPTTPSPSNPGDSAVEVDGVVIEPYKNDLSGENKWWVSVQPRSGKPVRVFLRPDRQGRVSDLWPGQQIKLRGKRTPTEISTYGEDFVDAEVISLGAAPKHLTLSVDELLAAFRDDPKKAADKYRDIYLLVTGVVAASKEGKSVIDAVTLTGSKEGLEAPTLLRVDTPVVFKPPTKNLKVGTKTTVKIMNPFLHDDQLRTHGGWFPG